MEIKKRQYDLCHDEIKAFGDQMGQLERNSAIIVGVMFSWLITHEISNSWVGITVWFVPAIIVILSAWRVYGLNKLMELREQYLLELEKSMPEDFRMYTFIDNGRKKGRKTIVGFSAYTYWVILVLTCLVIPILKMINLIGIQ